MKNIYSALIVFFVISLTLKSNNDVIAFEDKAINLTINNEEIYIKPIFPNRENNSFYFFIKSKNSINKDVLSKLELRMKDVKQKEYFVSPSLFDTSNMGIIFYTFANQVKNRNDLELIDLANDEKYSLVPYSAAQLNDEYKQQQLEADIIWACMEAESGKVDKLKEVYNKTVSFDNKQYLKKLFPYYALLSNYYKLVEDKPKERLNNLEESILYGNRNQKDLISYDTELNKLLDSLFSQKAYDSLQSKLLPVLSNINIFKRLLPDSTINKIQFYQLFSDYMIKPDEYLKNKGLIDEIDGILDNLKDLSDDYYYNALFMRGYINYLEANYGNAINDYETIIKSENAPEDIISKARDNKVKAQNKVDNK